MKKILPLLLLSLHFVALSQQIRVLPSTTTPRFTNKNREWSSAYANVSICQWKDDKLATVSVTLDDNHYAPDNNFWMQKSTEYGWKWTWFLIPSRIESNPSYNGTWNQWSIVKANGHDLQSHSQNHCSSSMLSTNMEYSLAKQNINQNITGAQVQTLAYPNGYPGCSNDSIVAKNYYLSSRGVYGAIQNVTKINFHNVNSIGNFNNFFDAESHFASFTGALNPANTSKFRTWYVALFHNLTDAIKTQTIAVFDYLKANEADIWVATYTDAAKYAQEFATASISNMYADNNTISFNLNDQMYDEWYDFPLSVKVNINGWNSLSVKQNNQDIPFKIVSYGTNKYAIIQAIPNKGIITLSKNESTLSTDEYVFSKNFDYYKIFDYNSRLIKQCNKGVKIESISLSKGLYFIVFYKDNVPIGKINYRK